MRLHIPGIALTIVCVFGMGAGLHPLPDAATVGADADDLSAHTLLFEIGAGDVYTISADGETLTELFAHNTVELSNPAWSPDGQLVAFSGNQENNLDVFVIRADGTDLVNLTQSPEADGIPVWFPDSQRLLFRRWHESNWESSRLYVMNVDGTGLLPFLEDVRANEFEWSPDGHWLLYSVGPALPNSLYRMSADGHEIVPITGSEFDERHTTWSPDGEQIAFVSKREGNFELYVMDADGSHLQRLTETPDIMELRPVWSPDGRYIAYRQAQGSFEPLYVWPTDGTPPVRIGEDQFLYNVDDYAWSPDSSYLAVCGRGDEGAYLYVVDSRCIESPSGCGADDAFNLFADYPDLARHRYSAISLSWRPPVE